MNSTDQQLQAALAHHRAGQLAEAEKIYRQILASNPTQAHAIHYLGVLAAQTGHLKEADAMISQAITLQPGIAEFHVNLALTKMLQSDAAGAESQARIAISIQPRDFPALNVLGAALKQLNRHQDALDCCRQMLAINPNSPEVHANMGITLTELKQFANAMEPLQRAISLRPNYPEALNLLGMIHHWRGESDEAIAYYRRAIEFQPDAAAIHSNLLLTKNCAMQADGGLLSDHTEWANLYAARHYPKNSDFSNDRDPNRPLRIGYVSPDFRQHATLFFFEPLLMAHHRKVFEIFCYSNVAQPDAVTNRLKSLADHWRDISKLPDDAATKLIGEDRIDILVDLAGHTANHRLLLFAHRPAPIQITYLGYPNTSGLATMDYRLSDKESDPPGMTEDFHSEKLLRLEGGFLCYRPPANAPLPRIHENANELSLNFGSFNSISKVIPEIIALWSQILLRVPKSRLILKADGVSDALRQKFEKHGVDPNRIELMGPSPSVAEHLAVYQQVDIALDTFPYHGTTTTCEAMWMGVPVVTLAGHAHLSRVGVSLLSQVGLQELIASTQDQYVRIAESLAVDGPRRRQISSGLRERMSRSPLCDAERLAGEVESAFHRIWQNWCREQNGQEK